MIKAFSLLFNSAATWDQIAQTRRGFFRVLIIYLLPMVILAGAVEGWGLHHWGKWQPRFQLLKVFPVRTTITFEVIQVFMSVAMVLISALLLMKISQTFHSRGNYTQAFTSMAYAFSPLFLMRLLDASPAINPLVPWGLGALMAIMVFYQGLPRMMDPDPAHAFGLYLSMIFVMILTSGVMQVSTAMYLLGYLDLKGSALVRTFPGLFQ